MTNQEIAKLVAAMTPEEIARLRTELNQAPQQNAELSAKKTIANGDISTPQSKIDGIPNELAPELVDEINKTVADEKKKMAVTPKKRTTAPPDIMILTDAEVEKALWRNQKGDAELFIKLAAGRFVYDKQFAAEASKGIWYEFKENYWQEDVNGNVETYIDLLAARYTKLSLKYREKAQHPETIKDLQKTQALIQLSNKLKDRAFALRSVPRIRNVLRLAHSGVQSLSFSETWDDHPTLLPVANGVVDLETGKLIDGNPKQYMRSFTGVEYHGLNAEAPTWNDLTQKVFCENESLIDYFYRVVLGSCAVGISTKDLFIAYGPGGDNGKSILFDALTRILGQFATTFSIETLLDSGQIKSASGPSPELFKFMGKRFASTSEAEQKHRFSMAKVKQICSGGDTMTARELYAKKDVEFKVTHTTLVHTNFLPRAAGNDKAFYNRAKILKFGARFVPPDGIIKPEPEKFIYPAIPRDKLEQMLIAESPGILACIVRAAMRFLKDRDLSAPQCVLQEGTEYQEDQDLTGRFLDQSCEISSEARTQMKDLYAAFVKYSIDIEGMERKRVNSQIWLSRELRAKQEIELIQKKPVAIYGLAIKPEAICDCEERENWNLAL